MVMTVMSGFHDHVLLITNLSGSSECYIYIHSNDLPLDVVDLLPASAALGLKALTLVAGLAPPALTP